MLSAILFFLSIHKISTALPPLYAQFAVLVSIIKSLFSILCVSYEYIGHFSAISQYYIL